ncbi:MAG: DUF3842 family protein [Clostridiales bacterium]
MKIAVVDGQGGGIGKIIVEKLRIAFGDTIKIIALGTNALAVSLMIKAGADEGASGENAIIYSASKVNIIMGPIGIIVANSMLGELTPKMSSAISESNADKILIPVNKCNLHIANVKDDNISSHIENAIELIEKIAGADL